ncbi:restriction endonuclease subunit S [Vibrio brasiliensis]|uniref:Type I restriction-modification enzyme, specificity subunit n=1 Tax=Vibrio brasiliensis LMG 20546 TaxID=945543 RepID=E8LXU7_9VIBR|nr:restriction endonuclease subunit S [Vibrio brasiliensis]EGA64515.1 type I restriction-modification enzyme, specificity subunit [Vibrio brasiliensis LMG 20546]
MALSRKWKIRDFCDLVKGNSPTLKTEPGEYPLVVTADFRRSSNDFQFDVEAVCIPLVSSTGHGNAAIHRVHYQSGKFALANIMVALIPNNLELCYPKYLYYLLQSSKDHVLVPLMKGTSNVSLKVKDIAEVELYLPTLENQIEAVSKIDEALAKVNEVKSLRHSLIMESNAFLQSVFQKVIEGADYQKMEDVAPVVRRKVEIDIDGEYPELGARSFGKGIFHKPTLNGFELDWQKLYAVHDGDLVISNIKAWEGAIAAAGPKDHGRVGSHRYLTCLPKPGVTTAKFLSFYLLSNQGIAKVQAASPGSADRNRTLAIKRLEKIEVPIPDFDTQLWFSQLLDGVEQIKQVQESNRLELEALVPAILDKAIKGKLV